MLGFFIFMYLAITLFIGIWISSRVRNSNDFISAGRKLPFVFNTFALFALWFGSETVFGASSEFAEKGFQGVIEDPFGAALCLVIYAAVFSRVLYRRNFLTLGDLFRDTYGRGVELVSSFLMVISFVGYIAAQLVALAILANVIFGLSITTGIIISAVIVCIYTLTGGMWAVSVTDFIQSLIIMIGLAWVAFSLSGYGRNALNIIEHAPRGHFQFLPKATSSGILNYVAAWMVIGLGSLPSQDLFQRFNSARTEKSAMYAGYLGSVIYLIFALLPLFIVLSIKVIYPETDFTDAQKVIPTIILEHSSLPIQVMMLGALMSAIFSTCSGAILAPSTLLAENLIRPVFHLKENSSGFLWVLRLSVIVMTILGISMAMIKGNIYNLVGESSILGLVSMLIPMMNALFSKNHYATGAYGSMLLGFIAWLLAEHVLELGIPPLMIGLAMSVIGLYLGNWIEIIYKKRGSY